MDSPLSPIQAGLPVPMAASMAPHVPIALDHIKVASPCHASWDEMSGDDRARFCGQCGKHVYNLSAMSQADAEALVNRTEGRLCVRFYRRSDGTMLTQDCPVGWRAARRRMLLLSGTAAAVLVAFLGVVTSLVAGAVGIGWANGWLPRPLVWLVELFEPAPLRPNNGPMPPLPVRGGGEHVVVMGDMCPPVPAPPQ
jgi:hypothetical protein